MEEGEIIQSRMEELKRKIHRTDIYIRSDNEELKTRFKKLAKEQFNDSYEFCLRWLLDCSEGLFADKNDEIFAKIDILTEEINKIKTKLEVPVEEKPKRVSVSGRRF